jgi:uncharacterized protein
VSWYAGGLRFECTGCGRCCTHGDGYVWTSEEEIVALAAHLGMTLDDFGRRYLRRVGSRYALVDGPGGECVFLDGKSCSIYEARPAQCRAFPWWPANLESPEAWTEAASTCEGISDVAPVVVAEVIDDALASARKAGLKGRSKLEQAPEAGKETR